MILEIENIYIMAEYWTISLFFSEVELCGGIISSESADEVWTLNIEMVEFGGTEHFLPLKILHGALCLLYFVAFGGSLNVDFIFALSLSLFCCLFCCYFFLKNCLLSKGAWCFQPKLCRSFHFYSFNFSWFPFLNFISKVKSY